MGLFNNIFPYSDFHEMNLDWILKLVKQISDEWDVTKEQIQQFETSVTTQMNEYMDTINGRVDGIQTTVNEIYDNVNAIVRQTVIDVFGDDIAAAVSDWLDAHPEATTTVQDHSLTIHKLVLNTLGYLMPEMFGGASDGITDNSQAISDALDFINTAGGGILKFSAGTYLISEPIVVYDSVKYVGSGKHITTIKTSDNASVFVSDNFSTFTGTIVDYDDSTVPKNFEIRDLCVDGDWNEAEVENTSNGIQIYGCKYMIDNVRIQNLSGIGFYSEYNQTRFNDNVGYKYWKDSEIDIEVYQTGKESVIFRGPADITFKRLYCAMGCLSGTSDVYNSSTPSAVVFDGTGDYRGTCELGEFHVFGQKFGYGVETKGTVRLKATKLIIESCAGGLLTSSDTYSQIDTLDIHDITAGTLSPQLTYFTDNSTVNTIISNLLINRYNDSTEKDCLVLNGRRKLISGYINCNNRAGLAVKMNCSDGIYNFVIIGNPTGTAIQSTDNAYRNTITADVIDCLYGIDVSNLGTGNHFKLSTLLYNSEIPVYGTPAKHNDFNIISRNGSSYSEIPTVLYGYQLIDLTTTSEQTINVPNTLPFVPGPNMCMPYIYNNYGFNDYVVDYITVSAADASNITVKLKLGTASVSANRNVHCMINVSGMMN